MTTEAWIRVSDRARKLLKMEAARLGYSMSETIEHLLGGRYEL